MLNCITVSLQDWTVSPSPFRSWSFRENSPTPTTPPLCPSRQAKPPHTATQNKALSLSWLSLGSQFFFFGSQNKSMVFRTNRWRERNVRFKRPLPRLNCITVCPPFSIFSGELSSASKTTTQRNAENHRFVLTLFWKPKKIQNKSMVFSPINQRPKRLLNLSDLNIP